MLKKIVTIALILSTYSSFSQSLSTNQKEKLLLNNQKFSNFLYYLVNGYIEEEDPDKITEDAITAVLEKLDPHSSYITKEEMKSVNDSFDGNFEGIGIEFNVLKDTLIVVNTVKGGPSEQVGLKSGDRIVKVDGESVIGIKQLEVPKILRGTKGTSVVLDVFRQSEADTLTFHIIRDKIPIVSLDAAYMIDDSIAYVKLNRFMATTTDEYKEAMAKMPNASALILDLRGNTGGYLDQAISLSDQFLSSNELIVYTEGRAIPRRNSFATNLGNFKDKRLIVLVDEESASASEIVAGAIQDHDRGIVIGRPSFGKGLVQQQIQLPDSSAIRLTIARYYTPSGRAIQRPYTMGDKEQYYADYYKRYTSGELVNKDSLHNAMPDSLKSKTLKLGRTVYGGGGITPDIYVGMDTTRFSKSWSAIIRSGVITNYVIDYVDKTRKSLLKKYPNFEDFEANYDISEEFIDDLIELAREKDAVIDRDDFFASNLENAKLQLKGIIAQKLWDYTEMYKILNSDDEVLTKAIEVLSEPENVYLKPE
ncbi:MAG: S41 family peptidase [Rikenellaceae bacterium]